ncbi:MAG TPA: sulfotransferase [Gammaproteobacteria bacterium]|jgi:hypothetical protein
MRLPAPFIKLPLRFDVARLRAEVEQFPESEWRGHPQGFAGNSALVLVSHQGGENDDTTGAMAPAPRLERCPYLKQVMQSFHTVMGRSRLMRLEPGAEVTPHTDIDLYWRDRIRIHVPIVTDASVRFNCDGVEIHMGPGEAWIFDNWRPHHVINGSGIRRVHLVMDTVGSAAFWQLASTGVVASAAAEIATRPVEFEPAAADTLVYESHAPEPLAHPAAVKSAIHELVGDLRGNPGRSREQAALEAALMDFTNDWQALWARFGAEPRWHSHYAVLLEDTLRTAGGLGAGIRLPSNRTPVNQVLQRFLPAMFPGLGDWLQRAPQPRLSRPVFVVAAPRSGSTLLFEALRRHPDLWSLGDESHAEIENVPGLSPRERGFESNILGVEDASSGVKAEVSRNFGMQLRDAAGRRWLTLDQQHDRPLRLLEKTPKNALRIAFLDALFPDALFLFLHREPAANLGSILDAWRSGRFITYPDLPGWEGPPWSLLLPPGWRRLNGRPIAEVAAHQWQSANQAILDDLSRLPRQRWRALDYAELVRDPAGAVARAFRFMDLGPSQLSTSPGGGLPLSRYTLTPPSPDKWRQHERELDPVLGSLAATLARISALDNRL